ncbi:hypothetical protein L596_021322 [Steinernema carpocapsae]|uniref:Uncharacterized protein n=1 Tax=Steinernema carpocapsae TaxID=34508 RepID=A0A4U5MID4_STECR|nr:hypothetical protein L596_021322 [Steinernema carpocapsae]
MCPNSRKYQKNWKSIFPVLSWFSEQSLSEAVAVPEEEASYLRKLAFGRNGHCIMSYPFDVIPSVADVVPVFRISKKLSKIHTCYRILLLIFYASSQKLGQKSSTWWRLFKRRVRF